MNSKKKTKIVATIGPASESYEIMEKMVKKGLNVVRLNFSHGTHEEHLNRVKTARAISKDLGVPIGVLQDLSGPKIRIGSLKNEKLELKTGSNFILTIEEITGDENKVFVSYKKLPSEVKKGGIIFLRDGRVKLEVIKTDSKNVYCKIIEGGEIKSKAGVNVPNAYLSISCLTEKDRKDLKFGLENDVDFMAISFVRKASDVQELRELIKSKPYIKIISKIETGEAIENLEEIIKVSDAVMVARGDLATEMPAEEVPILQKRIIKICNKEGKPVIVATQMLESMISSPIPTRAEVNDIANAILDGADAVMLSEETTLGKHPETAVATMEKVAMHTEKNYPYEDSLKKEHLAFKDSTDGISYAAVNLAHDLNTQTITALSVSGFTANMISRHRPKRPIIVITPNLKTYNQVSLNFNCYPVLSEMFDGVTDTIEKSKALALSSGLVKKGDSTVIVAGLPFSKPGNTNLVLYQKI